MPRFSVTNRDHLARSVVSSVVVAAVATASILGPSQTSFAQPKGAVGAGSSSATAKQVTDAARKEAQERFKRGVDLQSSGNLEAAVIEFERAYDLSPAYQVLYNIAVVYRDKGDRASALRAFERFLSEGKENVDAKRRKDVEGEITKLREVVATVSIKASVAGVDVTIDDVPMGKTPFDHPILVNVGRHKFEASKEGFRGETQFWTLAGKDSRTVEFNLKEIKTDTPPPPTTTTPPATTPPPATTSAPPPATTRISSDGSSQRTIGYGLTIAGVLGLGLGGFFGLQARSQWNEAKSSCPNNKCKDPDSQDKAESAKSNANLSTLGFGLGGTALVAGVVFIILSTSGGDGEKSSAKQRLRVAPSLGQREGGVVLGGSF